MINWWKNLNRFERARFKEAVLAVSGIIMIFNMMFFLLVVCCSHAQAHECPTRDPILTQITENMRLVLAIEYFLPERRQVMRRFEEMMHERVKALNQCERDTSSGMFSHDNILLACYETSAWMLRIIDWNLNPYPLPFEGIR